MYTRSRVALRDNRRRLIFGDTSRASTCTGTPASLCLEHTLDLSRALLSMGNAVENPRICRWFLAKRAFLLLLSMERIGGWFLVSCRGNVLLSEDSGGLEYPINRPTKSFEERSQTFDISMRACMHNVEYRG